MTECKHIWTFFSVLTAAFEEEISFSTLTRWAETGIFEASPFGQTDRYICQGVKQMKFWLEDLQRDSGQLERLRQDYLQLFIGTPKPLAPFWGSVYMDEDKLMFQQKTAEVGRWYRKYGLAVRQDKGMPEDYLVYELCFVLALLEAYQSAVKVGEGKKAEEHIRNIRDFVNEQMMPWIPLWREELMLYGRTEYYRGLCNMVYGSVRCLSQLEVEL